jgi:hypothetical protein
LHRAALARLAHTAQVGADAMLAPPTTPPRRGRRDDTMPLQTPICRVDYVLHSFFLGLGLYELRRAAAQRQEC